MTSGPPKRAPPLTVIEGSPSTGGDAFDFARDKRPDSVDWSILMAHAQTGDATAYRRLLEEIIPYLRSLVVRHHRDPRDVEDTIQDVLLTIHAIRYTYDPTRPFGPWLIAIARRRIIDRMRHQGRLRTREAALLTEHETFLHGGTNIESEVLNRRVVEAAVSCLPASERQAIRLLKLRQLSLKEAAAVSGMSIAALKSATNRALKSLHKILSDRSGPS